MAATLQLKTHLLTGYVNNAGTHRTFCGRMGWEESGNEFTDAKCNRFEAVARREEATCAICLKSFEAEAAKLSSMSLTG